MKSFPAPLTSSEEKYYFQKYTEGDLQAKHILIEHNLRLVAHVIKKYQSSDDDIEDLISKNISILIVNPVDSDAVAPAVNDIQ